MGDPGIFEHGQAITSVKRIVREPAKANLMARDVVLDEVRVVQVLGNYTFLVGSEENSVPVILRGELTERQPEIATEIREGQVVRVYGIARLLRSIREIADLTMLTMEEARTLADHEVYVSGERVVVLND